MHCRAGAALAAALMIGLSGLIVQAAPARTNYVEGEVLVLFRDPTDALAPRRTADRHALTLVRHFGWQSRRGGRSCGLLRSGGRTTAELIAELRQDPAVEIVEPNYLRYPCAFRTPSDPLFPQLWGLKNTGQLVNGSSGTAQADVGFLSAWGMARPSSNEVVVAVIDTGVDYTHPDLVGNMWSNPGEIPGNGVDDDGNGYVDDVHGYDFADSDADPMDVDALDGHGSHVAGTIAASGNNLTGIVGVDFHARIMALKASSDGTYVSDAAILQAIQYATLMKQRGMNVVAINASFGGPDSSAMERTAIADAGDEGIVFCAAAGNETNDNDVTPSYPAGYNLSNIIAVAATDQDDQLAGFSNYGASTVDIAAPGVNILSVRPVWSVGTSATFQQSSNVYSANGLEYAGTTTGITATLYDCGLGYPSDFPAGVVGNIAFIQRGTLYFSEKVTNAMAAGAVAVVIYNNVSGNFEGTLGSPTAWIPAVSISQTDGQALLPLLPAAGTVVNAVDPSAIYRFLEGTSMATPHVAGAVAFAAMNFPNETAWQRIQRILSNATPLAGLQGLVSSGGRLNLARMVDTDGNGLPDWWEQLYFNHPTGTDPSGDPDHDTKTTLDEWLSGTNPTNRSSVLQFRAIHRTSSHTVELQWPSAEGRYYRLLGGANPSTGFGDIIRTNIAATPPLNTEIDTETNTAARFYLLELEP